MEKVKKFLGYFSRNKEAIESKSDENKEESK